MPAIIPPARREYLEALSDAQLRAELRGIRDAMAVHAPHVTSLRASRAMEALRQSESFVLTIQGERA